MNKKIPVYILTGFLGSGKTTLLLQLLQDSYDRGLKPAVILNELGEINVERHLFQDQHLIELLNGCICCTIKEDLTKEMKHFLDSINLTERPDIIFVEGTGVANPNEVFEALTSPLLLDQLEVHSIISLVDASRFLEYQSIFSSSKEIRKILKEQITESTLLILNKIDLVEPAKLKKVEQKLQQLIHPRVPVIKTSFTQVEMQDILHPRIKNEVLHLIDQTSEQVCDHDHDYEHEHEHDHHHHDKSSAHTHEHPHSHALFQTIKIDNVGPVHRSTLENWFKSLPSKILRAKGIVQLAGENNHYQFQFASQQLQLVKMDQIDEKPTIIIIGHDLSGKEIKESFQHSFQESMLDQAVRSERI